MQLPQPKTAKLAGISKPSTPRANFRRIERREWWLWTAAAIVTLLLTLGLASFLVPNAQLQQDY
ncbi:MAG: hypothetical protein WBQ08_13565, partial [Candidatus Sulfotelmatobacter sp.]